jgi:hypothetical protein
VIRTNWFVAKLDSWSRDFYKYMDVISLKLTLLLLR